MKLIVGLGNPGNEYNNTRHNIGFMCIDEIAKNYNTQISLNKFNGLYSQIKINGENILLLKPQKYMNLSGEVVRSYIQYFKIDNDDILIICDDLDTPVGKYKLKSHGSSGGHNGLKNIELNIGTNIYKRIKIGISNDKTKDTKDYVLGHLTTAELELINPIIKLIPSVINDFTKMKFDNLMNKYNK